MNATRLINITARANKILALKSVRAEMAKAPDADWEVNASLNRISGSVHLGYIDPEYDNADIRDIATDADSDSWVLRLTPINKVLRGGIQVQLELVAYQKYTPDEIETLKAIGVLRETQQQAYTYTTLACHAR